MGSFDHLSRIHWIIYTFIQWLMFDFEFWQFIIAKMGYIYSVSCYTKRGIAGWSNTHECYDKMNAFQRRVLKLTCLSFTLDISSAIHGWNVNIEFVSKGDVWDITKFTKRKLKKNVFIYKDIVKYLQKDTIYFDLDGFLLSKVIKICEFRL